MASVREKVLDLMMKYIPQDISCPVCGSTEFRLLSEQDRYGLPLSVVVCQKCELIQVDHRMPRKFYDEFYSKYYRDLHDIEGRIGGFSEYFDWQYERAKQVFGDVKEDRPMQILEIGCSAGGILQHCKDCGHTVQGIDLDPKYVEYGKSRGLNISVDTIDTVKIDERPEYVIMSHVIEHLLDPVSVLKKVREIMHPRGHLFIECPGAGNLLKYNMDFKKSLQLAHVYYFHLHPLERLLEKCGFLLVGGTEDIQALFRPYFKDIPKKFIVGGESESICSDPKGQSTPRMIVGHPRSGTVYMSRFLQKIGVDMKHQELGKDGTVSWQHICDNEYRVECDTVIHQVRHPLKVIASTAYTLGDGAFPFMFDCIGNPPNPHPLAVAMWTWIKWNELIEKRAIGRFQIENFGIADVTDMLGIKEINTIGVMIPKNINSIPHVDTSWAELEVVDSELCEKVKEMAIKYGYK